MSERVLERAFELARSGRCKDMTALERQLRDEGYGNMAQQLQGPQLRRQLAALIKAAHLDTPRGAAAAIQV